MYTPFTLIKGLILFFFFCYGMISFLSDIGSWINKLFTNKDYIDECDKAGV